MSLQRPRIALEQIRDPQARAAMASMSEWCNKVFGLLKAMSETSDQTGKVLLKAALVAEEVSERPDQRSTYGVTGQIVRYRRPGGVSAPLLYVKLPPTGTDTNWEPLYDPGGDITITLENGGTGSDLSATGPGWLRQASGGANVTVRELVAGDLPSSGVTPGSYKKANVTVDSYGRVTVAADGESFPTPPGGVLPAAGSGYDGVAYRTVQSPGVEQEIVVCLKSAGGTWNWIRIVGGGP